MTAPAKDIDTYIALQPENLQPYLQLLRQAIREAAPEAEEVISYKMPAFRYHGMLVGFAAARNHFGFYPWNGHTVADFKADLAGYTTTKGSIHFPKNKPVPVALVKKIVKQRVKENLRNATIHQS
jgi:uncharacterized protein YdhG (YjbR/CyaY superfamily)